eukprot:10627085-Lingulodinium_polyedra.AAC.1
MSTCPRCEPQGPWRPCTRARLARRTGGHATSSGPSPPSGVSRELPVALRQPRARPQRWLR